MQPTGTVGQNPISGFRGDVLLKKNVDGRTHGRRTLKDHKSFVLS